MNGTRKNWTKLIFAAWKKRRESIYYLCAFIICLSDSNINLHNTWTFFERKHWGQRINFIYSLVGLFQLPYGSVRSGFWFSNWCTLFLFVTYLQFNHMFYIVARIAVKVQGTNGFPIEKWMKKGFFLKKNRESILFSSMQSVFFSFNFFLFCFEVKFIYLKCKAINEEELN